MFNEISRLRFASLEMTVGKNASLEMTVEKNASLESMLITND